MQGCSRLRMLIASEHVHGDTMLQSSRGRMLKSRGDYKESHPRSVAGIWVDGVCLVRLVALRLGGELDVRWLVGWMGVLHAGLNWVGLVHLLVVSLPLKLQRDVGRAGRSRRRGAAIALVDNEFALCVCAVFVPGCVGVYVVSSFPHVKITALMVDNRPWIMCPDELQPAKHVR